MKRKILFLLIIACLTAVSPGQRRNRTKIQRIIQLTKPATSGGMTFQKALANLRPANRFTGQAIDKTDIGQLAWAGLGNRMDPGLTTITPQPLESPFPTQIFIVANDGVFYYQPINHSLEQIAEGDVRLTLANEKATSMPGPVSSAGCIMIVTSSVTRSSASRRGSTPTSTKSVMLLEAGHIAQNIQLQAECLEDGLGSITISDFNENNVSKICNLPRGADVLYMVCVGYLTEQDRQGDRDSSNSTTTKRAAIIVPSENFQDEEFWETKNMLDSARILVTVASNRPGWIKGMNRIGSPFEVQVPVEQIRVNDFDSIVIIGGAGAAMFFDNRIVLDIINEAFQKRKIIGATSRGTLVLANAGILKGIKVTGLIEESGAIQNAGAVFTNLPVEKDMRVITCAGPQAARTFAIALADAIHGK